MRHSLNRLPGAALVGTDLAVDHPPDFPFDQVNRGLFVVAIDPSALQSIQKCTFSEMLIHVLDREV